MTTVGVIAHRKKSFGGGLGELRRLLDDRGFSTPLWYEISSSKRSSDAVAKAIKSGADLLIVWGGDGTVQRCIDTLADSKLSLAIMPAGTANLLAANLGIPNDLERALDIALHGARRRVDLGVLNGEHFAVMAGAGLDALMMKEADGRLKERFGRLAYVWTGAKATQPKAPKAAVKVDGRKWFDGRASCLLFGNFGTLTGGLEAFPKASVDDGILEIGVVTAQGTLQWAQVLSHLAVGRAERSRFIRMTRGREVDVRFNRPTHYELDGGARPATRRLRARSEPGAVSICVPEASNS